MTTMAIAPARRQLNIHGITTKLRNNRTQALLGVDPQTGRLLKQFTQDHQVELAIEITPLPGFSFVAIKIDEDTNEVSQLDVIEVPGGGSKFSSVVKFEKLPGKSGVLVPTRDSANIRVIAVAPDGECAMWNIALVAQEGDMYLVHQFVFSAFAYRSGDRIELPRLATVRKWENVGPFLGDMLSRVEGLTLKDISEYAPVEKTYVDGEVKWYSPRTQVGCIYTPKGDVKVYWKNIQTKREDGPKYLVQGEIVTYDLHPIQGAKPGGFQYEAKNVVVCS